ncbi:MAG: hypothetical protein ACKO14_12020 [Armatimonadota bacterium]
MESLKEKAVSPFVLIIVGVVVVGAIVFFGFLKPRMDEANALRAFNSPEAQKQRDPDTRTTSPTTQEKLIEFLAKDPGAQQHQLGRRRSRE